MIRFLASVLSLALRATAFSALAALTHGQSRTGDAMRARIVDIDENGVPGLTLHYRAFSGHQGAVQSDAGGFVLLPAALSGPVWMSLGGDCNYVPWSHASELPRVWCSGQERTPCPARSYLGPVDLKIPSVLPKPSLRLIAWDVGLARVTNWDARRRGSWRGWADQLQGRLLVVERAAAVEIRVLDVLGRPAVGAQVNVADVKLTTGNDGTVVVRGLRAPLRYAVEVRTPGAVRVAEWHPFTSGPRLTVQQLPGARVAGLCPRLLRYPNPAGRAVELVRVLDAPLSDEVVAWTTVADDRSFEFADVRPGTYFVRVLDLHRDVLSRSAHHEVAHAERWAPTLPRDW